MFLDGGVMVITSVRHPPSNLLLCLVARVAFDELTESHPAAITKATAILDEFAQYTKLEDKHRFVESATFPDVIKRKGWGDQAHWHFVDTPFLDGIEESLAPNVFNVTWEIEELKYALKYANPDSTSFTDVSYAFGDSFNLRLLIHYVGDVHQPLHATTRYTPDMPKGDRGGKSFRLAKHGDIDELHALWDSAVLKYSTDPDLPLSDTEWGTIGGIADTLRQTYPRSTFDNIDATPYEWANESFELAKSFVYKNVAEGGWPDDTYIQAGQVICDQRLVLAGYRLADTISKMWGSSADELTE